MIKIEKKENFIKRINNQSNNQLFKIKQSYIIDLQVNILQL